VLTWAGWVPWAQAGPTQPHVGGVGPWAQAGRRSLTWAGWVPGAQAGPTQPHVGGVGAGGAGGPTQPHVGGVGAVGVGGPTQPHVGGVGAVGVGGPPPLTPGAGWVPWAQALPDTAGRKKAHLRRPRQADPCASQGQPAPTAPTSPPPWLAWVEADADAPTPPIGPVT